MRKMTLTRQQWERVSTWLALNQHVVDVEIVEYTDSGIGHSHTAYFLDSEHAVAHEMDITDVSTW
jgi:hypothetical protein